MFLLYFTFIIFIFFISQLHVIFILFFLSHKALYVLPWISWKWSVKKLYDNRNLCTDSFMLIWVSFSATGTMNWMAPEVLERPYPFGTIYMNHLHAIISSAFVLYLCMGDKEYSLSFHHIQNRGNIIVLCIKRGSKTKNLLCNFDFI